MRASKRVRNLVYAWAGCEVERRSFCRLVGGERGLLGFARFWDEVDVQAGDEFGQFIMVAFPEYPFLLENGRDMFSGKRAHRDERGDVIVL